MLDSYRPRQQRSGHMLWKIECISHFYMQDNNSTRTRLVYGPRSVLALAFGALMWTDRLISHLQPTTVRFSSCLPISLPPYFLLLSLTAFRAQSKFRSVIEIGEERSSLDPTSSRPTRCFLGLEMRTCHLITHSRQRYRYTSVTSVDLSPDVTFAHI